MPLSHRSRAQQALRIHAPELAEVALEHLGQGLDNTAFLAGDLVLRVARDDTVLGESQLLAAIATHVSVPVPAVRFTDPDARVLAYQHLPGRPLLGRPAPGGLARVLGRFLSDLHAIDRAAIAGLVPADPARPDEWLEDLDGPAPLLRLLHETCPAPGPRLVLAHADLGAEHILEQDGEITGIIDWTDAAITDPAVDFARVYRDFGPRFLADTLTAYDHQIDDAFRERTVFFARCAALEDRAFGLETGRSDYSKAAERSLAWLFPQE